MKYLIFSDIHSHNYREFSETKDDGINSRLDDCVIVLEELDAFCKREEILNIIFVGDLYHLKNNIDSQVIKLTIEFLEQLCRERHSIFVPGNHDYRMWSSEPILLELFRDSVMREVWHNIKVITKPTWILDFYFEPYTRRIDDLNNRIKSLETTEKSVFFGHQDVIGAHYGAFEVTRGLDADILSKKFKMSFIGHNHNHDRYKENVISVGAPLQHNFSDFGKNRGWIVYDDETNEMDYYQNNFSPSFWDIKVSIDDEGKELPGNPERDFYRINVSGNKLPKICQRIKWKRVIFNKESDRKARSKISFSDKNEDLIAKYVDLKISEGFDRQKLIEIGRGYL